MKKGQRHLQKHGFNVLTDNLTSHKVNHQISVVEVGVTHELLLQIARINDRFLTNMLYELFLATDPNSKTRKQLLLVKPFYSWQE